MKKTFLRIGYFLSTIGTLAFMPVLSKAQTLPAGYVHEKVLSTELPTALAFTPDGRPIICTSVGGKGKAIIVNPDGSSETFFELSKVYTNKEKGLVGLTFDPDFATNGYVYVYYTADLSSAGDQSSHNQNTIIRITAKNYIADMSSLTVLLKLHLNPRFLAQQPNHDGGTMAFGKDGKLYVASGDMDLWCAKRCIPNINQGCNCGGSIFYRPTYSQDTSVFLGKILRINKDGSAPTDNPFYKAGSTDARNYIFALGVRNPYTMHFRKGTTQLWINDVGSAADNSREEINMLDITNPSLKRNLGFNNGNIAPEDGTPPNTEGFFDVNENSAFKTFTSPIQVYSRKDGCAISGGTFYEPKVPTFEAKYMGKYFFMDFCQGWIKYMDADGKNIQTFATGLAGGGSGFGSVAIEEGPEGFMYHIVRSTQAGVSGLYRIKGPLAVGVDKEIANNKYAFSVHPNPSSEGKLNVHYNAQIAEDAVVEIFDQMGKSVKTFNINGGVGFNDYLFDIEGLERGVYTVKFSTANAKASKKLVVK